MDDATLLRTARRNLMDKLFAYSQNPLPSYSVEGQSLSYSEYLKMLMEGIKTINDLLVNAEPFEIRSVFG